jgi:hypothetical protein
MLTIQRGFAVIFPYMYIMHVYQIHPLHYSFSTLLPLFKTILMGFILFSYIYIKHFVLGSFFWALILHVREKMQCLSFSVWFILLNKMISSSIHFPGKMTRFHSSLWLSNHPMYLYTTFLYPFIGDGHLRWFHSLIIVNSAVMNTGVQVSLLYADLHVSWYMPRRGIAYRGIWEFYFSFFSLYWLP